MAVVVLFVVNARGKREREKHANEKEANANTKSVRELSGTPPRISRPVNQMMRKVKQ